MVEAVSRPPKLYDFRGERLPLREISARVGVSLTVLRYRLYDGWDLESATQYPVERRRRRRDEYELDMRSLAVATAYPGGASQVEIANAIGISRARVQQIEAVALRKLGIAIKRELRVHAYAEAM